ncbi:MAG: RluA family pseudouridine synthase [Pseudomonadota bacterium]
MDDRPDSHQPDAPDDMIIATLGDSHRGLRLDKALALALPDLSRARLQQLMVDGCITGPNHQPVVNPAAKVNQLGDYAVRIPPAEDAIPKPETIPLDVIFEDDHLLVINKPAGLVVHPAAGHATGTLVNALLHHCGDSLSGIGGVRRPGIVHRLDKETSGLIVVAKHDQAHQGLATQFADRTLSRRYQALVWGQPKPHQGHITGAIGRHAQHRKKMTVVEQGGKPAGTHYAVTEVFGRVASLTECRLDTGRTHQIRVHMAHLGHPLIGDDIYGDTRFARRQAGLLPDEIKSQLPRNRQMLHAFHLTFTHPITEQSQDYTCALPDDISLLIEQLRTM